MCRYDYTTLAARHSGPLQARVQSGGIEAGRYGLRVICAQYPELYELHLRDPDRRRSSTHINMA